MHERHEHEQYFFTRDTVERLAGFLARFERPACLCTPTVGAQLAARKVSVRTLEIDERFAQTPGFLHFDMYRPRPLAESFDVILCDPPFEKVSLAQLFTAVRSLAHGDFGQRLLLCYPVERAGAVLGTFAPFGLVPTGVHPQYVTVQAHGPRGIELFGNLGPELHALLAAAW